MFNEEGLTRGLGFQRPAGSLQARYGENRKRVIQEFDPMNIGHVFE